LALCGTVSAYAIGHAGLAVAAADSSAASVQVSEVLVTAERRSENIQKVPMAVEAVSAAVIRDRGIQNLDDLQSEVTGLKFGHFSGGDNVTIRGVGSAFVSGAGQSSVAIYVDGVYLSQIESLGMGQADLSGIEVLKGPQGTLYGRNSNGGVVNFTTNAPTNHFSYGGSVGYGNYNDIKAEGYVSGPIADRVRLRLFVQTERRQGDIINDFTGQKLNGVNTFGGRLSLDADVTDRWKTEIRLSSWKDDYTGPVYDAFYPKFSLLPAPFFDFDPYRVNSPVHYGSARTNNVAAVKNTVRLTDQIRLVSTTGFNDFLNKEALDALGDALLPLPIVIRRRADEFTQEFNLVSESEKIKWIAGAYYFHERVGQTNLTDESNLAGLTPIHTFIGPAATSVLQHGRLRSVEDSGSLFGDVSYNVTDGTKIFGGLRVTYDQVRQKLTEGISAFGANVDSCSPTTDPEFVKDTSLTGRIGAQQTITSSSMVYAQYSHGYKTPGFSQSTCRNPFKAETIDAEEVGYKSQWFDGRLTFNADAFHYGYDNLQLEQATLTGIPVVNAPKAHIWGFEATIVARPLATLRFDAGVVLLDAHYDQFINQDPNNGEVLGANLAGVQLNNAPSAAGNIGVEFDQNWDRFGKITWRAEASLTTSYHVREFNRPWTIQNGYGLVNLYSTYQTPDGHYQLRLFARNVGNVTVLSGELGFGGALGEFEMPRTYGAEASVRF